MKSLAMVALAAALAMPGIWPGFPATPAQAQSQAQSQAAQRGLEIAREAERRDSGWRDAQVGMTMLLQDRRGNTRKRSLRMMMLEVPGDKGGDMSIAIFDSPADMKGTLLLTRARVGADDDQWLYLPALKRVKRISSSNKTGAFFGSEFTYEDIAAPEIGKFTYEYLGTRPCGGRTCLVVARKPAYRNSGYSKLITWFDSKTYRVERIEYLDRRGKMVKVLGLADYKLYKGRFWRARTLTMKNLKTGRATVLKYDDWRFGTGLSAATFSKGNLRNIR